MKRYGIVSYNLHCNFTNYGSALQQYALQKAVERIAPGEIEPVILDYCPDVLRDVDPLNPFRHMWDQDATSRRMCELTLPAIRENWEKFQKFFKTHYRLSEGKYTSDNFNESLATEGLDGYICGSDTIWCIREFKGFDDGYYGNFEAMRKSRTISYAASFGDVDWQPDELDILKVRLQNFKAISIRENGMEDFIRANTSVPFAHVCDPTLLLKPEDYAEITAAPQMNEPYVLLYARRHNPAMEAYADKIAAEKGCRVVEISLRATNADRHIMRYDAGVEEFLALVKGATCVVTNSFHGVIMSILFQTPFMVFPRYQCDSKIDQLLARLGFSERKMQSGNECMSAIDFTGTMKRIELIVGKSLVYLSNALRISG